MIAILNQLAIPLVIAVGMSFVIVIGSIDLSADGVVGMAASYLSVLVINSKTETNVGVFAGISISVLACVLTGFVNGLAHVKLKMPSFMVTFSTMYVCSGFAMMSYGARPATIMDPLLTQIPKMSVLGVPVITLVALILFIIAYIMQEYTSFGRYIYAIGADEQVLRALGVNVEKVKIIVFTIAGFCFGIAGVLGGIRLGLGQLEIGQGTMFPAVAAVVMGGTSLSGGKGGVLNTFVGVLIMTVLINGLDLCGINPYYKTAIHGTIILVAVAFTIDHGRKVIAK
jgi:ribose transport system permease protein